MLKPETSQIGRRERRKAETRRRILEASMRLFEEKGILSTTVEDITEAADIGKGTFFNYFPSKEAVLWTVAERQLAVMERTTEKGNGAASIHRVLKEMFDQLSTSPKCGLRMRRSLLGLLLISPMLLEAFSRGLSQGRKNVARIIARGQEMKEVRCDISALEIALWFQQVAFGTLFMWAVSQPSSRAAWQARSIDLFWRSIAAHPAPVSLQTEKAKNGQVLLKLKSARRQA